MASMDVTPQELRDIEIREAWRGYHRDDVDELLERAAATIEHLEVEAQELRARAQSGGPPPPVPTPAPAPAVAPAAPPAPTPPPIRTADTDVIQRTLVLAQKAADEAVAEARVRAQQMVGDAEQRAQQLVDEAEASASAIAERERSKLEDEIGKLQGARDTLNADVDALEQFERDYRDRLRVAIQAELDLLVQTKSIGERPSLHDVELPAVSAPASWSASSSAEPTPPPATSDSWSASAEGAIGATAAPAGAEDSGRATVHIDAVAAGDSSWDPAPAGGWNETPTAAVVDDSGEYPVADDHAGHSESLDDDAFFASLREAVRDDAPMGTDDDEAAFFDEEDTEEHRRLFKRKR